MRQQQRAGERRNLSDIRNRFMALYGKPGEANVQKHLDLFCHARRRNAQGRASKAKRLLANIHISGRGKSIQRIWPALCLFSSLHANLFLCEQQWEAVTQERQGKAAQSGLNASLLPLSATHMHSTVQLLFFAKKKREIERESETESITMP